MAGFKKLLFPKSRLATVDVYAVGKNRHHVAALIEVDINRSRELIRKYRQKKGFISFTAWLIKVISHTLSSHRQVGAFRSGKRELAIFDSMNVSVMVEKASAGQKAPLPLLIKSAEKQSIETIATLLKKATETTISADDLVLHRKPDRLEYFYPLLPGFIRRLIWRYLLQRPKLLFDKMGNVAFTSLPMIESVNGWFIPTTIHPVCFAIGAIKKKPAVADGKIVVSQKMSLTVLMDHDVVDGAQMALFIRDLTANIESGKFLNDQE